MGSSIKNTAETFKALGDETRLKIIKLIAAAGNNLCVGVLAHQTGVSQPAVSQHLKTLKNAGLIKSERKGQFLHYQIIEDFMAPYGVDTRDFLQSIDAEFDLEACCEYKGKAADCGALNK
jgi:DNA-binding transcriptional ArsR family regulator